MREEGVVEGGAGPDDGDGQGWGGHAQHLAAGHGQQVEDVGALPYSRGGLIASTGS